MNIYDLDSSQRTHFNEWTDLAQALMRAGRDECFWRGMTNATWCLESSLDRFIREAHVPNDRDATRAAVSSNLREVLAEADLPGPGNDEDELWAWAQHQGVPSPYLDWTASGWIALYFALTGVDASLPPSARTAAIVRIDRSILPSTGSDVRFVRVDYSQSNRRLTAQHGLFTESKSHSCLLDGLAKIGKTGGVQAYTFPMTISDRAISDLRAMTISDIRMYPDIVGAVREIRTRTLEAL